MVVWVDDANWGKLCFEYSPQRQPMLVSVVTRGTSDDCNAFVVDGFAVWLRVSRSGPTFAFHASTDGQSWRLIRYFSLDAGQSVQVGFEAQSPAGDGCSAMFSKIRFTPGPVADIRDGS
jgi:regulation of enolase protein 1 (concanavalin A-like superfamily)